VKKGWAEGAAGFLENSRKPTFLFLTVANRPWSWWLPLLWDETDHSATKRVRKNETVKNERTAMPYLHLDLPGTYPVEVKRELATRLCKLYAEVMETQLWRPNVGIAELGKDNLYHLGSDGLEPITMVMVEFRRGRPAEKRLALGRAIVDICIEVLGVPRRTVMVEFTPHTGEEMLRDGNWVADWTPAEGVAV
jgi:phenylpyruvate tautomerase PptA (4-oxalocrotonate tautomerase family)